MASLRVHFFWLVSVVALLGFAGETHANSARYRHRASRLPRHPLSAPCLPPEGHFTDRTLNGMQEFVTLQLSEQLERFAQSPLVVKAQTLVLGGAGPEAETAHYAQALARALEEAGAPAPVRSLPISVDLPSELQKAHNVGLVLTYRERPLGPTSSGNRFLHALATRVENSFARDAAHRSLVGYSYGSVVAAQTALKLASSGTSVENLVLVGSPISPDSDLAQALKQNSRIQKITWVDIPGDPFSSGVSLSKLPQVRSHFAFVGAEGSDEISAHQRELAEGIVKAFSVPNGEQRLQIPASFAEEAH